MKIHEAEAACLGEEPRFTPTGSGWLLNVGAIRIYMYSTHVDIYQDYGMPTQRKTTYAVAPTVTTKAAKAIEA